MRRGATGCTGSRSGAEGSRMVSRAADCRAVDPPIALEPLNEKDNTSRPMKGPPIIHSGINAFILYRLKQVVSDARLCINADDRQLLAGSSRRQTVILGR